MLVVFCAALLSACVTPQTEGPASSPQTAERLELDGESTNVAIGEWWSAFGDTRLDAMIRDALRASPDLAGALARLRSAHAPAIIANARKRSALRNCCG